MAVRIAFYAVDLVPFGRGVVGLCTARRRQPAGSTLAVTDLGWASLAGADVGGASFEGATYNLHTIWPDALPEEVRPRLKEPPPDAILSPDAIGCDEADI